MNNLPDSLLTLNCSSNNLSQLDRLPPNLINLCCTSNEGINNLDNLRVYYGHKEDGNDNYIDITDDKESVSFTPDRKVKEILQGQPELYQVGTRRQLTHNPTNDPIFDELGYDRYKDYWTPNDGQKGLIKAETVSPTSGKVFVLFEEYTDSDEKRYAVLNKDCVSRSDFDDSSIWKTSRNPIRIGRLVRPLLRSANITVTDREVEEFTNQFIISLIWNHC